MRVIKRNCPLCQSTTYDEVVILKQTDFTTSNPTYCLDCLPELGLYPEQKYPIVMCKQCSMIYSLFHLSDDAEAYVYNRIIDSGISTNRILTPKRRIKEVSKWLGLLKVAYESQPELFDLNVLDYGCGFGTLLLNAAGPGIRTVGFDITDWKVAWAREHGLTVTMTSEELKNYGPFDIVIATEVLEHLRSPAEAVKEMVSLLKPHGFALITCIIDVSIKRNWNEIRKMVTKGKPIPKEINPWEHLNYFTVETLSKLLSQIGFCPVVPKPNTNKLAEYIQNILPPSLNFFPFFGKTIIPIYWQLKD